MKLPPPYIMVKFHEESIDFHVIDLSQPNNQILMRSQMLPRWYVLFTHWFNSERCAFAL